MAHDEQAVALYDFLYRDSGRFDSYYAQIFGGRLFSLEKSVSERGSLDAGTKVNVAVASADFKSLEETQSSSKEIIDPHDVRTTDVLTFLQENEYIHNDVNDAPHSSLILAKGTLVFIDRHMLELATVAFDAAIQEETNKPKSKRDQSSIKLATLVKMFLSKLQIPSAFLLRTDLGVQVVGTINDIGMEEPIPSYYFKHGTAGLAGVYVIGVKEVPSPAFSLPNTQLMGVGQQAAQHLSDMLFPSDAIRVTPIALFRKL